MNHIYKITNKLNGKIYIGQSTKDDPSYLGSGIIIIKSVEKYGRDNFIKEVIEYCEGDVVNEREIYWINFYNSTDRKIGYNISTGGNGGNLGDMVNEKISLRQKGKILSKDIFGNIFIVDKNDERYLNGELVGFHKNMKPSNKGVPMSDEQKQKLRKPKPKTEEYKNKMRDAINKRPKIMIVCLNTGVVYNSMKDAAEELNLTIPNIIQVLKGRRLETKGYSFKYL
jgi:group I intron endonuclease